MQNPLGYWTCEPCSPPAENTKCWCHEFKKTAARNPSGTRVCCLPVYWWEMQKHCIWKPPLRSRCCLAVDRREERMEEKKSLSQPPLCVSLLRFLMLVPISTLRMTRVSLCRNFVSLLFVSVDARKCHGLNVYVPPKPMMVKP